MVEITNFWRVYFLEKWISDLRSKMRLVAFFGKVSCINYQSNNLYRKYFEAQNLSGFENLTGLNLLHFKPIIPT